MIHPSYVFSISDSVCPYFSPYCTFCNLYIFNFAKYTFICPSFRHCLKNYGVIIALLLHNVNSKNVKIAIFILQKLQY